MRIRHEIEAPKITEAKERILDSRWFPAAILGVISVICVIAAKKQSQVIINNFTSDS